MSRYDDIKGQTRPQYPDLPPMSIHDRACQFSPFAALVGYEETLQETQRLTDSRRVLEDDEIAELNRQLQRLKERLKEQPAVRVTYFIDDTKKAGGSYYSKVGEVRTINESTNGIVFTDKEEVLIKDLYSLVFVSR